MHPLCSRVLPTVLVPCSFAALPGQTLLKDIHTAPNTNPNSDLHDMLTIGQRSFLGITTPLLSQLWTSDGTGSGTTLVREIGTTGAPGPVAYFCDVGGLLFFSAADGRYGEELWRSDGTESGTVLVKDITPGAAGSLLHGLTEVNGLLVFGTFRGTVGRGSLWRSDGTGPGTIELTPTLTTIHGRVGNVALFVRNDPATGEELWATDASLAGTTLLADCNPGTASSGPGDFSRFGTQMLFSADVGGAARETWITDGTAAGTRPLRLVHPGFDGALPASLTAFGTDYLCLKRQAGAAELWRGDGSLQGTALLKSLGGDTYDPTIHVIGTNAVFECSDGPHGHEVWVTDGTAAGTQFIDIYVGGGNGDPQSFFRGSQYVYFSVYDSVIGREPYRSDGTVAGTVLVRDIDPGGNGSDPYGFFEVQGRVVFAAHDGTNGTELWTTDGTAAGTSLLLDIHSGSVNSDPDRPVMVNGITLFSAIDDTHGRELWRMDGTTAGTSLVADLNGGGVSAGSLPSRLTELNGDLMFSVFQPGRAIWHSDGTAAGTVELAAGLTLGIDRVVANGLLFTTDTTGALVVSDGTAARTGVLIDAQNMPVTRNAVLLGAIGTEVFLFNNVGLAGVGLWRSDGSAAGTTALVPDLEPSDRGSTSTNRRWALLNGIGYFRARDRNAQDGFELWRTDGTAAGTTLVHDIHPGPGSSSPNVLSVVDGALVFQADDGSRGRELWRSDGTGGGTAIVVDLNPGTGDGVSGLWPPSSIDNDATMLFPGDDGVHGLELFRTDGTAGGTTLVRDSIPGPDTIFINQSATAGRWVVSGNLLYFPADDGQLGMELWASDGTDAGTRLVRDIRPDEASSFPAMLTAMDSTGRLLFTASSPNLGTELWQTDGTAVGTQLVADMTPGPRNTTFGESRRIGSDIYFTADEGTYGREIWVLSVTDVQGTIVERFGYGCAGSPARVPRLLGGGLPRLGEAGFTLGLAGGAPTALAVLQLGTSWSYTSLGRGCVWWPARAALQLSTYTDAFGAASWPLPVPRDPELMGLELVAQAAQLGDGVGPAISATNGVYLLVGR